MIQPNLLTPASLAHSGKPFGERDLVATVMLSYGQAAGPVVICGFLPGRLHDALRRLQHQNAALRQFRGLREAPVSGLAIRPTVDARTIVLII
jgi:hypothetical protein